MKKRLKQVHEIVQSPEYQGQEINLHNDDEETSDSLSINSCDEDEESDSEPIMVFLDTITSDISIDSIIRSMQLHGQKFRSWQRRTRGIS